MQENPFAPPNFPDHFAGWDAIMDHHRSLPRTFAKMAFSDLVIHRCADPNQVIAEFNGHIELKAGGRYDNRYISAFSFDDEGKITNVREYFSPSVLTGSFAGDGPKLHGLSNG